MTDGRAITAGRCKRKVKTLVEWAIDHVSRMKYLGVRTRFFEAGHHWVLSMSVLPGGDFNVRLTQLDKQPAKNDIGITFQLRDVGHFSMQVGFRDAQHADVTLVADERVFPTHKFILAARSPVFHAMFATPMKETQLNRVDISDVSAVVLETLLEYIYTNHISDEKRISIELLVAADKYELLDLKHACATVIASSLRVGNAIDILQVARLHNERQLTRDVIAFINQHGDDAQLMSAFLELGKKQPDLLAEAYGMSVIKPSSGGESVDIEA